jgi:hypothetical protein
MPSYTKVSSDQPLLECTIGDHFEVIVERFPTVTPYRRQVRFSQRLCELISGDIPPALRRVGPDLEESGRANVQCRAQIPLGIHANHCQLILISMLDCSPVHTVVSPVASADR